MLRVRVRKARTRQGSVAASWARASLSDFVPEIGWERGSENVHGFFGEGSHELVRSDLSKRETEFGGVLLVRTVEPG